MIVASIQSEFQRYKSLAEKALSQIQDKELHKIIGEDNNSIAVIMNHLSGNLKSRFTNFLTEDGEKTWRNRDQEFEERAEARTVLLQKWEQGWGVLFESLSVLHDSDLSKAVKIREQEMSVAAALQRSLAHVSYHVGQIVLLARIHVGKEWKSLSIPRGKSQEFYLKMSTKLKS